MNEKFLAAAVAVEKTGYSYDRLYNYAVPEEMSGKLFEGCRVKVSFGHGLRQGIVMHLYETEDISGLKEISQLIDREPVLSAEMLSLGEFMKEHCYCTYFDAFKAMLPTGLSVRLTYSYSADKDADISGFLLSSEEIGVVEYLLARGKPVRQDLLLKALSVNDEGILDCLVEKGIINKTETIKKRISDVTVRMIRLKGEIPERKYTPSQEEVLRVLTDVGEASVKEICYFTGVGISVPDNLVKRGICEYFDAEPPKTEPLTEAETAGENIILTSQQEQSYNDLLKQYKSGKPSVSLLYGITGSGKTSVFMKLIDRVNEDGRGIICMVPEIALTPQLLSKFTARYGKRIAIFHSGLSLGKRLEEWKRVKNGQANIAVGTRSAIFAPMENIGLIVMDEEQEYSYKSSAAPRFHARELAKYRCLINKCPLVLSSATPSVESCYYAQNGRYLLSRLDRRYGNARLPHVITADMNIEREQGNNSGYSSVLLEAIDDNLKYGHQSIILLNRRGHNTFVACRSCNEVISCPNCSISLTFHSANNRLMCHYCGYSIPAPDKCPSCGSDKLRYSGAGTQRAEQELRGFFPDARILRLDTDSTMQRYAYEKKLGDFRNGEYDIMLGTQMVAKGLDFPNVTLVGVLSADSMLHGDDFRSYERTFSLLTQVVGRSGRGGLEGRAIIQTYEPQNPIIEFAAAQNYDEFFKAEIVLRRAMLYPPFADIGVVAFSSQDRQKTHDAADYFTDRLKAVAKEIYSELPLRVMGPSPAAISKIGGKYRYRIIIKFKNCKRFREMMSGLLIEFGNNRQYSEVSVYADIDPDSII